MIFVFNWNHFEMRFLNLRINFYLLQTFFKIKKPHVKMIPIEDKYKKKKKIRYGPDSRRTDKDL